MRKVERKVNKENIKLGLILCFFMWLVTYVIAFGDMS